MELLERTVAMVLVGLMRRSRTVAGSEEGLGIPVSISEIPRDHCAQRPKGPLGDRLAIAGT